MRIGCITILSIPAALLALCVWGCFGIAHHIIVAVDRFGDAGAGLAQTAARLNGKHGTLAMLDEDIGAAKSAIVHVDLVARHEQQQLSTWDDRGTQLYTNINGGVTDLRSAINAGADTARAATDTARAATAALGEGKATISTANGLVGDLRLSVPQLNRALTAGADAAEHTSGITAHVEGTTADLQVALHPILNPEPCKTRGCKLKRVLGVFKASGTGAEGLYYLIQVARALF
jgi:hypothetical protein